MFVNPKRIAKGLYWERPLKLVEGCSYVSEGCQNCWSAREAHMRSKQENPKIQEQYAGLTNDACKWNGKIRLMHKNLELPLRIKKPTIWAVWNDLFHEDVPFDFFVDALNMMCEAGQHTYLILTKRPERMHKFIRNIEDWDSSETPHIWLGTTVENQEQADKRIPILLQTPAAVYFVSHEPALGSIVYPPDFLALGRKALVITGGESGPGARPMHPDWARLDRDQCQRHDVNFFFKQHGEWESFYDRDKDDPDWQNIPKEEAGICRLNLDGGRGFHGERVVYFRRVGKKRAGRLLDSRTWSEMPKAVT